MILPRRDIEALLRDLENIVSGMSVDAARRADELGRDPHGPERSYYWSGQRDALVRVRGIVKDMRSNLR